jgi:hypothetical protein
MPALRKRAVDATWNGVGAGDDSKERYPIEEYS